jgi:hypothetical protein
MEKFEQPGGSGPVTLEDVAAALGDTDPYQTNAGILRRTLGRGSLSTIQRHLETLRRQQKAAEGVDTAHGEIVAPDAPRGLLRGMWEAAYGLALASVQDRLIRAHERIAALESVNQGQIEEIEVLAALVDQAEAERDQFKSEAKAAREAQLRAEADLVAALKLHDQIAALASKIDAVIHVP